MNVSTPMKLSSLMAAVKAEPLTKLQEKDIAGCYISDLLSDVLARAQPGVLWLTVQAHRNVVSCAATKDVGAVLLTCGRKPEPEVVAEADENDVILLSTPLKTFEAAGRLWEAGLQ
jgi:predicted transcriptional regulator